MQVQVNGELRAIEEGITLEALIRNLGVDPAVVAAEVNGEVLSRDAFPGRVLAEGDRVELVRMVGGG